MRKIIIIIALLKSGFVFGQYSVEVYTDGNNSDTLYFRNDSSFRFINGEYVFESKNNPKKLTHASTLIGAISPEWLNILNKPTTFPTDSFTNATRARVQKLGDSINANVNGKAALAHGHVISDVTSLQTSLNTKMNIWYAADAGANDSYVITLSPIPAAYFTGMQITFKANTVNTGAASINVNGLGVKTIVKRVNTVLANGDIPALRLCVVIYDGTNFVLQNPIVN